MLDNQIVLYGQDAHGVLGFSCVKDWLLSVALSFPRPWRVEPLQAKYYGTVISDGRRKPILRFWTAEGSPSAREKVGFGDWSPEAWAEYCCDSHWESATALRNAEALVLFRNSAEGGFSNDPEQLIELLLLARWDMAVYEELASGGGPNKRRIRFPPRKT